MNNTLLDLNNHLFAEIERLGDEDLTGDALDVEINRANAIQQVADKIIHNGELVLKACKYNDEKFDCESSMPKMLSGERS